MDSDYKIDGPCVFSDCEGSLIVNKSLCPDTCCVKTIVNHDCSKCEDLTLICDTCGYFYQE